MTYTFSTALHTEGSRCFAAVPFNVWEETSLRGNIPCRICVEEHTFECKLIPKGAGVYWIPVQKSVAAALPQGTPLDVSLTPIASLTRICYDSPYSRERPIRRIDGVEPLPVVPGYCGHGCVAMLAGVSLADAIARMGKAHASWSKILEALDYYGISYAEKAVYPRNGRPPLPHCCIANVDNAFLLWYGGAFQGVREAPQGRMISYLEIITP